jgi:ComF family protein
MNNLGESLFATLFPSDCRICGTPLINISRLPVCRQCISQIHSLSVTVCEICGEGIASPYVLNGQSARPLCGLCRQAEPPYEKAVAYGSYSGNLRELIHLLKYEQVRPATRVLGRMLAEVIMSIENRFPAKDVIVVPVPLHTSKRRQRAFNQAETITRAALSVLKKQGVNNAEASQLLLKTNVLERCRATKSQIGLTRPQRQENMRGAFRVVHPEVIRGQTVLLIDDVVTTGTTISECARVLRKAGASKVYVASVARTLKTEVQDLEKDFALTNLQREDLDGDNLEEDLGREDLAAAGS